MAIPSLSQIGFRNAAYRLAFIAAFLISIIAVPHNALAQSSNSYTAEEVVQSGHRFFGSTSGGIASAVEKAFQSFGLPNGYILGEEGSGAFIGGLTYGEGTLYTKNAGDHRTFWQGPSLGWDFGGQGSRVMMLVYNLDDIQSLYGRYAGVAGSAYVIAGVGFNVLKRENIMLVPIRTGVGARLGINIGYLKLSAAPTWNPF
ncbi:EipA family protein [Brucella sp. 21LCYQ03]|nr:EipA family protein [Brucella sp. 21LCYQ03]